MDSRNFPIESHPSGILPSAAYPLTICVEPPLRALLYVDSDGAEATALTAALAQIGVDLLAARADEPELASVDLGIVGPLPATAGGPARTKEIVQVLRHAGVAVLVLASRAEDDVLLQDCSAADRRRRRLISLELAQQVRNVLRHNPARVLRFEGLEIETARREVTCNGELVELRRREFDLLVFLASSPERAFTRRELLEGVWQSSGDWQALSTVTEHIRRLRDKLSAPPGAPGRIVTVRNIGYRFDPTPRAEVSGRDNVETARQIRDWNRNAEQESLAIPTAELA